MLKILIFFVSAFAAFRPVLREGECPDEDLAILCDSHCYIDYAACKDACEESGCERICLNAYAGCYSRCPCFELCPNGCSDCDNSVCTCRSPEIDNIDHRQCIKEANDHFTSCVGNCQYTERACYDQCYSLLVEESDKCPCNSGCPLGCPCESGYSCQKYITAICQRQSASSYVDFSYMISANGHIQENRYYSSPLSTGSYQFLYNSGFAILNGQMFLYGGNQDPKKVARIEECAIEDTGKRLINNFYGIEGSLVTLPEIVEETILCNSYSTTALKCESFNGEATKAMSDVQVQHQQGCMSLYLGQAVIIAGYHSDSVEFLEFSGWQNLTEHPGGSTFYRHTCASTDDGILTVGGYSGSSFSKEVFYFKNDQWTVAGKMQNNYQFGSMIFLDSFFIVFGGNNNYNTVERAEWQNETVTSTSVIHDHGGDCLHPIVFETRPDQCSEFCSQDFCYFLP
ncbi:Oidioi.mRNA.OKI2018_I69.chr1.g1292.t1.cds [Oikopleura dioica]|uniref:Oidioi.mRNA.OKI2018_I69.chr1.g1292.t1.cds n=1 Tax=Oikopleura dioica TaxID=34765 RepID=A0ABN7STT6_OIKDI|nr:Oidioi.mRNA.OKI2018_I69.chr1.g1292.t1.cds [Oikopleura dioica]